MIRYRQAGPDDAGTLRAFVQAIADRDGGAEVGPVEAFVRHGFGERPLFRAILAERGGKALGMVLFFPEFSTHRGEPGTHVQDVFVEKAARREGIGRALIAEAQNCGAAEWGSCYVTLGVGPANAAAQAAYRAMGFRRRGYDYLIFDGEGLAALTAP